ncbi:CHAT domain-containing protein [Streptomyces sp. PmtG]
MLQYEELRIRVRPFGPSHFLVAVSGPSCAADVIAVDGEPAAFRARWDRLVEADLGYAPMGERHTVEQLRELGRGVYELLFGAARGGRGAAGAGGTPGAHAAPHTAPGRDAGPVTGPGYAPGPHAFPHPPGPPAAPSTGTGTGICLSSAFDLAQRMAPARGLRLRFDLPPRLRELPLETLCAPPDRPEQSLALHPHYSLVRSLPGGSLGGRLPGPADEPSLIRLVVACASPPAAGPPLRLDAEVAALRQELPEVAVRTTVVEAATRERLESALGAHGDLPTVVLLIAHGAYDEELGKGVVCLETRSGGVDEVPADLLSAILLKAPRLRLAVLNLCSGADSSGPDGVHAEPFSGLAQALIGGGLPAVVAMRGRVSDVSAGRFSPELLKGLAANRTLDESVSAARRRMSHLPRHTAVEWATPALFLHEGYRHGWLFKAREVRDDGGAVADPLREGADALEAFQNPFGHVDATTLIGAARFARDQGRWAQVQRILGTPTRQYEDEQRRLRTEAAYELAWPELEKLCALLATDHDGAAAAARLAVVHEALPHPLPGPLVARAERLRIAAGLLERARAAEAAADWEGAIALYEEVAAADLGFPEAPARLAAARAALRAATALAAAERAHRDADWDTAARAYADVLALRPDTPGAAVRAAYARGRAAESAGDWPGAIEAYGACGERARGGVPAGPPGAGPEVGDAAPRLSYARGRAAADAGDWAAAATAFAACRIPDGEPPGGEAPGAHLDADGRHAYARARLCREGADWDGALAWLGGLSNGFGDVADQALYARGRAADARGAWADVIDGFGRLPDAYADGDVGVRRRYAPRPPRRRRAPRLGRGLRAARGRAGHRTRRHGRPAAPQGGGPRGRGAGRLDPGLRHPRAGVPGRRGAPRHRAAPGPRHRRAPAPVPLRPRPHPRGRRPLARRAARVPRPARRLGGRAVAAAVRERPRRRRGRRARRDRRGMARGRRGVRGLRAGRGRGRPRGLRRARPVRAAAGRRRRRRVGRGRGGRRGAGHPAGRPRPRRVRARAHRRRPPGVGEGGRRLPRLPGPPGRRRPSRLRRGPVAGGGRAVERRRGRL